MPGDAPELTETKRVACQAARDRAAFPSPGEAIARVRGHVAELERGILDNPLLDIGCARRLAQSLIAALGRTRDMDRGRLSWLMSATAYFCEHVDRFHDVEDLIGLEDDAFVVA